jgi:hypothetical protein
MAVSFRTVLMPGGRNAVGIVVPADVMVRLGPGKRYPVVVTIGGHSYRNSVAWYRGAFMIPVSAEHRLAAGVSGGQEVEVTLEVDDAPREFDIPEALADALRAAGVFDAFSAFSYSRQRGFVEPWAAARTDETRERNLAKIIEAARG